MSTTPVSDASITPTLATVNATTTLPSPASTIPMKKGATNSKKMESGSLSSSPTKGQTRRSASKGRNGGGGGNAERRGSNSSTSGRSSGTTGNLKDAKDVGGSKGGAKSEGLTNLKNLINELSSTTSSTGSVNQVTSSPTRDRRNRTKSSSSPSKSHSTLGPSPTIVAPPPSSTLGPNTLNPNAGGFQPSQLGVLHDFANEGLITPTASHFDLMTGRLNSPGRPVVGGGGVARNREEQSNSNSQRNQFAFPQSPNQSQSSQLQSQDYQQSSSSQGPYHNDPASIAIAQMQAMQSHHQQRYSIDASTVNQDTPGELLAEQLAIQQQLEALRVQQESLLSRFTDMQLQQQHQLQQAINSGSQGPGSPSSTHANASSRSNHQSQQPSLGGHRRMQSFQNSTGVMGSFGTTAGSGHNRNPSISSDAGGFSGGGGPGEMEFSERGLAANLNNNNNSLGFNRSGSVSYGHARKESAQGSISSLNGWSSNNQSSSHLTPQAQLAEASSHLSQLAAYRSSSGHSRVPSFGMSSLGNAGQLAMAGYGGGIMPSVGGGSGGGGGAQQRKSLFAPYLPQNSIAPLIKAGKLVIGTLRVNKKNRSDAYITVDGLDTDVYVCGSKDRNRALEGDVVAIELLDVDEVWGTKKGKEDKKRKKEEAVVGAAAADLKNARSPSKSGSISAKKEDLDTDSGLMLLEPDEPEVTDEQRPQYAGHVVAVVERAAGQLFSGMLGVLRPSSAATMAKQENERHGFGGNGYGYGGRDNRASAVVPKIIWFRPTDKRVPLIAIPTDQAPLDFVTSPHVYANRLFVACIKRWPITSLHPFGTLVEELGEIGDVESETKAILKDCGFSNDDFNENVVKCLPAVPWSIPEHETSPDVRRDFRENRVFTIDPETARDLDDALHIIDNGDETFEVGVHIADVSHFVKPNSALDREARKRATTVYLVQRAVPMLPRLLSEELCSLTAGLDKLTFSVVFKMSKDGKILETWFGKSIINSAVKLAYSDAQEVIEGRPLPELKIVAKDGRDGVEQDIKMMADLARQIRARRFETGALRIDNVKVSFGLDENGIPDDATAFVRREANELIEEFMLSANIAVAGKIASGFPEQALLRNHAPPLDRRLTQFIDRMARLDITLDGSSSGSLMQSIDKITDPNSRSTLQHLATKSMQRAKYFCTGSLDISKFQHYALNVPLYTHFTSPIRRYADIIVHRQLEAILTGASAEMRSIHDTDAVTKIATVCNVKKDAAKLASEQSAHLFLCVLIDNLTMRFGPVVRNATVVGVLDSAFDVMIPEFGIEKRVHTDQIPIEGHTYDEETNSLSIRWKSGKNVLSWLAKNNSNDAHLQRVVAAASIVHSKAGMTEEELSKLSRQHVKSLDRTKPVFEGTEELSRTQRVRELQTVPVIIMADLSKSPPVIRVVSLNPFA